MGEVFMRLKRLRYTLAVGACVVFLFSGCATTAQVKDLQNENLALNQKVSELEAELVSEKATKEEEFALLEDEMRALRESIENSVAPVPVQIGGVSASEGNIASLRAETDRLKFLNEILLEASSANVLTIKPDETSLTVGMERIRVTQAVSNGGFLGFLSAKDRPDDRGRASASSAQAVSVSWFDAVQYCNWLSAQWQYDVYYVINNASEEVQFNLSGRRNGYHLPSQAELAAAIQSGVLSKDVASRIGLLSSEPNRAYRYDQTRNSLVPLDASLPVNNIGFMVVRNEN
jgi:outer membrane murein-binding lipoprotein Lpp